VSRASIGVIGAGAFHEGLGLEVATSLETGRSVHGGAAIRIAAL